MKSLFSRSRCLIFLALAGTSARSQDLSWIRQLGTIDSDSLNAAAPDGTGGVYVCGYTFGNLGGTSSGGTDAWLARYDSAGNQIWIRQLGTGPTSGDRAFAAAADASGGVFVSGYTFGNLGGPPSGAADVWLAHYDNAGNQNWIRQFGTGLADVVKATAADGSGGVYLSGETQGSLGGPSYGNLDAWLAHYDGAGNQTWIRQLGTSQFDRAHAAAADGSGGVYVGGSTDGSLAPNPTGGDDVWLARYDSAGNQTWIRQFGTTSPDVAKAAAADGSGGVYVSGETQGSLGGPSYGQIDAWLAHYDSAGNQTWIRQLGTSSGDNAYAAAPDGSGGVYVSGSTAGSLGGPHAGSFDAWLARYDSAGNQLRIHQLGTSGWDDSYAAAPDGSGGVYVGGRTDGSLGGPNATGYDDAWLARYEAVATSFCTAKSGLACGTPQIDASGIPSASATSGFVIRAGPARSCKSGILLYNTTSLAAGVQFQGGTLCVTASGIRRGGPTNSQGTPGGASCDGEFALDMNAFAAGVWSVPDCAGLPSGLAANNPAAFLLIAGQDVYCQFWGRDSVSTGSFVSAGIQYTIEP